MKKSMIILLVLGLIVVISGTVFAEIKMPIVTDTYHIQDSSGFEFEWCSPRYLDLTSETNGVNTTEIHLSWAVQYGPVVAVRIYKDGQLAIEKDIPQGCYSMVFTEPEVLGISNKHVWTVKFKAGDCPYPHDWLKIVNTYMSFTGIRIYGAVPVDPNPEM